MSQHRLSSELWKYPTSRRFDIRGEDWTKLFEERPRDFGEKAAWLSDLEQRRGKEWYDRFFTWYLRRLHYLPRGNLPIKESNFQYNLTELHWDPENTAMRFVYRTACLWSVSNTPDFSLGQYNGHTVVGLVLNGSALDPPTMGIKIFDLLRVQCSMHIWTCLLDCVFRSWQKAICAS